MGILFFSATFVWYMFSLDKYFVNYTQNTYINACRSSCKASCYCFQTSTKIGMWWHNLVKDTYNIFHQNPCTGSWVLTYRQTDRQTDSHGEPNRNSFATVHCEHIKTCTYNHEQSPNKAV
jgi:hypothetical protein